MTPSDSGGIPWKPTAALSSQRTVPPVESRLSHLFSDTPANWKFVVPAKRHSRVCCRGLPALAEDWLSVVEILARYQVLGAPVLLVPMEVVHQFSPVTGFWMPWR